MKQFFISHLQDLLDAFSELKERRRPYRIAVVDLRPTNGQKGHEEWLRVNSYFHRSVVPTLCEMEGMSEKEAKQQLQVWFACVTEHSDHYEVESIGSMSLERLVEFVENCNNYLVAHYGDRANELLTMNVNKTKRVNK